MVGGVVAAGVVLVGTVVTAPGAWAADPVELTFLNVNDFHGRIDPAITVKLAGTIEQLRAEAGEENTLLLSAGDNLGASLFASASAQDQPTIDVLNALGLKASAVGNHEFDQGFADLTERIVGPDGAHNAQWAYLGANVYQKGTTTPALPEYATFDVDGVTVGVIGAVTEETSSLVSPAGIASLDFGDPVDAVNRVAGELTDGNPDNGEADVLVAEYHEGAPAGEATSTLDQQLAASPVFAKIVNDTSPAVDVIFTGHTHQTYAWTANGRPVIQTGSYGDNVGKVTLSYDPASQAVTVQDARNVPRTTTDDATLVATYPRVATVKTIVDEAIAAANAIGNTPVGSVTADITTAFSNGSYSDGGYTGGTRDDRASESTLGNLVANALLDTLSAPEWGGAQIGVVNPGGLRAELYRGDDGVITYAEANAVLPFVNNLWTTTLTGAQVKTMLEQQWQTNADGTIPSRAYLQLGLSDNVTYTYDPTAPLGAHIRSVTVDGQPLDPAGTYRIGTFSFLTAGGDNFRVLAQGTAARDSGLIDRDAWIGYLQEHPGLTPSFARHAVAVPSVPTSAEAGTQVSVPVSGLDLTSLGSPRNTSLEVRLDGAALGTVAVADGAATATATIPARTAAGAHVLTLVARPSGTTVTLPLQVTPARTATTTRLTAWPTVQKVGSPVRTTLTATVSAAKKGGPATTGTVEFVVDGTVVASAPLRFGAATATIPAASQAGSRQVVARYVGTSSLAPSQSSPVTLVTEKVRTWVSAYATSPFASQRSWLPTSVIATVGSDVFVVPAGHVELREGDRVVGQATVKGGWPPVSLKVPTSEPLGRHAYTVVFVPDDATAALGSTSWPVVVTVTR
jgi:5'-nucleotidase